MTKREIEIYLERINERMVRAYGRELQPLEREALRRDVEEFYAKRILAKKGNK